MESFDFPNRLSLERPRTPLPDTMEDKTDLYDDFPVSRKLVGEDNANPEIAFWVRHEQSVDENISD